MATDSPFDQFLSAAVDRRRVLGGALAFAGAARIARASESAAWPTRFIKIIVPFPAGGSTDAVARLVAEGLSQRLGQQVIIDNRPGASTNIGAAAAARSSPDGYTFLMGTPAIAVNPALFDSMPYDWEKDLVPVSMVSYFPNLLVVSNNVPVNSVDELIHYARANPGKLEFGSSGLGGAMHLSGELFKLMASVNILHVPYKGSAHAMSDLFSGRIALMFDNLPTILPHVRDGKVRALAVTSARRSPAAPEVPTVVEAGLAGYEVLSWNGIFAPAGISPDILARVRSEIDAVLQSTRMKEITASQGIETGSVSDSAGFVRAEAARWQPLVRSLKLKVG